MQCFLLSAGIVLFTFCLTESLAQQEDDETFRVLQLEALKASILEYLGMDAPPRSGEEASQHDLVRMYHQYRRVRHLLKENYTEEEELQPRRQRPFTELFPTTVEPINSTVELKQQWFRAAFYKTSHINNTLHLKQARLHIRSPHRNTITPSQPWLTKDVLVQMHNTSGFNTETVFHTKDLTTRDVTLDLTLEVQKWLEDTSTQFLVVEFCLIRKQHVQSKPRLSLKLDLSGERTRRALTAKEEAFEDKDEGHCKRRSLNVSFKDIGWSDWIIAPLSYTMHYCDGSCPHNYKPASMHTQVKSRLHLMSKGTTPQPCCVPAAYEPMVLMHYDSHGKLKLTPFNDLIVSECQCA